MSTIRKKPYIEAVIDGLSESQKLALLNVMNTPGDNVNADFKNMPEKGITPVYFKLDDVNTKTGILIYNDAGCTLIAYHRFQDVMLIKLNVAQATYERVNEYCDINEIRRILTVGEEVTAGEIDSGNAAENMILAADGDGGAEWKDTLDTIKPENVEAGDAVQLFGFDSEGNLVKDDIPEGITVDQSVIEDSENAVAGGAVYDELHDNYYDKTAADALLETKANVDGNYPTMTVGMADNLTPYDESAGDDQDDPFSFQATGTGNGSQSDFATGSSALMKEKRGNTVVVNQYSPTVSGSYWDFSQATGSFSDGVATFTANAFRGSVYSSRSLPITPNHYILITATFKTTTATDKIMLYTYGGYATKYTSATTSWQTVTFIALTNSSWGADLTQRNNFSIQDWRESGWDAVQVKNVYAIDLTQWFGSNDNIPADLLAHPENFFRYYQGSLAYNEGELVNANSRYIKCIGRQQWDEEVESGTFYSNGDENNVASEIRSKNYIKVIPGATYYLKNSNAIICEYDKDKNFIKTLYRGNETFEVEDNCCFIKFGTMGSYGTTYNHDITISVYYSGESGYDRYYPYEVLTNNDTGTEILRSAGSVCDIKLPDGTIKRNVGYVDLGSLTWEYTPNYSQGEGMFIASIEGIKNVSSSGSKANIVCSKYESVTADAQYLSTKNCISVYQTACFIRDTGYTSASDLTAALSGVYLFFELATPTEEQGTLFSENLVIDDFGSMDFAGTSDVPQGNLIFYPVDYKAFVDTLYDYTEGTPSDIALKSDLTDFLTETRDDTGITAETGITLDRAKLTKIGNIVFIDFILHNSSGDAIATNTKILELANDYRPSGTGYGLFNGTQGFEVKTNGDITTLEGLSAGQYVEYHGCFQI